MIPKRASVDEGIVDLSIHTIRASPNGSDDAQQDQERGRRADGKINDTYV